jgi:hypothetical protein
MTVRFRRVCGKCHKPIDWTEVKGFFHLEDKTTICEAAHVDLEVKEFPDEPSSNLDLQ